MHRIFAGVAIAALTLFAQAAFADSSIELFVGTTWTDDTDVEYSFELEDGTRFSPRIDTETENSISGGIRFTHYFLSVPGFDDVPGIGSDASIFGLSAGISAYRPDISAVAYDYDALTAGALEALPVRSITNGFVNNFFVDPNAPNNAGIGNLDEERLRDSPSPSAKRTTLSDVAIVPITVQAVMRLPLFVDDQYEDGRVTPYFAVGGGLFIIGYNDINKGVTVDSCDLPITHGPVCNPPPVEFIPALDPSIAANTVTVGGRRFARTDFRRFISPTGLNLNRPRESTQAVEFNSINDLDPDALRNFNVKGRSRKVGGGLDVRTGISLALTPVSAIFAEHRYTMTKANGSKFDTHHVQAGVSYNF